MSKMWMVTSGQFCGAFVVGDSGRVTHAAPFLARRVLGLDENSALQNVMRRPGTRVEQIVTGADGRVRVCNAKVG